MSGSDTETPNLFDCALREGLMLSGHTDLAEEKKKKKDLNLGLLYKLGPQKAYFPCTHKKF